jgi:hypothetical protein
MSLPISASDQFLLKECNLLYPAACQQVNEEALAIKVWCDHISAMIHTAYFSFLGTTWIFCIEFKIVRLFPEAGIKNMGEILKILLPEANEFYTVCL